MSACKSVYGCKIIEGSGDVSFNLGLGGGPKYSELGVSVNVDDVGDGCVIIEGSGDGSFNLGLGGGPKYSELGVSVDVDDVGDDFCDDIGDWIHTEDSRSAVLESILTGETEEDFDGDTFNSGEEVDLGENKRLKRDLSEGSLETGVVVEIV